MGNKPPAPPPPVTLDQFTKTFDPNKNGVKDAFQKGFSADVWDPNRNGVRNAFDKGIGTNSSIGRFVNKPDAAAFFSSDNFIKFGTELTLTPAVSQALQEVKKTGVNTKVPMWISEPIKKLPFIGEYLPEGQIDLMHPAPLIEKGMTQAVEDSNFVAHKFEQFGNDLKEIFDPSLLPPPDYSGYMNLLTEGVIAGLVVYGIYQFF